jgi:hypothetical protein
LVHKKAKTVVDSMFSPDEFNTILILLAEISDRIKENKKKAKAKKDNNTAHSPSSTILEKGGSGGASITPKKKTLKKGVDPINSQVLSQSVAKEYF